MKFGWSCNVSVKINTYTHAWWGLGEILGDLEIMSWMMRAMFQSKLTHTHEWYGPVAHG